jgi:hypothetical protein
LVTPSPILKLKNLLGIHLIFIFMKNLELTQMEHLSGGEYDCDFHMSLGLTVMTGGLTTAFTPGGAAILFAGALYSFYSAEIKGCTN